MRVKRGLTDVELAVSVTQILSGCANALRSKISCIAPT